MLDSNQVDSLITIVTHMNHDDLIHRCLNFNGSFPVDFTPDYLASMSLDRLRHIYVAMCLQNGSMPHDMASSAA